MDMKKYRRINALLLIAAMLIGLSGCHKQQAETRAGFNGIEHPHFVSGYYLLAQKFTS
jgi:hypothetical protein